MSNTVISLQLANSQLKKEVRELKAEIGKLQSKNAKLEVKNISAGLRIKALEKLKVLPETKLLSDTEVAKRIAFLLKKGGVSFVDGDGKPLSKN